MSKYLKYIMIASLGLLLTNCASSTFISITGLPKFLNAYSFNCALLAGVAIIIPYLYWYIYNINQEQVKMRLIVLY